MDLKKILQEKLKATREVNVEEKSYEKFESKLFLEMIKSSNSSADPSFQIIPQFYFKVCIK